MRHLRNAAAAVAIGLLGSVLCGAGIAQTPPTPARADNSGGAQTAPTPTGAEKKPIDVPQLFATTCGWCHNDGGRVAGKGPQLMDTKRSDDFIRMRITNGKEGAMPAFKGVLSDADIDAIIHYVRTLKPD